MAYSTLEPHQTRVLKLEPSSEHDAAIICSLSIVSLAESPRPHYEALSYVWGDLVERQEIHLDGHPTLVSRNLWIALKYIRHSDVPRILWIDAVCINQSDVQERNAQVRQMGRIYNQASRVLIWLGESDPQIDRTMSVLSIPEALEGKQDGDFPLDIAAGLYKILMRPWWRRVWVLQERVLASADPVVGCGGLWLGWKELSDALRDYTRSRLDASGTTIIDDQSTWIDEPSMILQRLLLGKQWNNPDLRDMSMTSVAGILEMTRGCGATDKRDQVFAVRDLLREEDKAEIPSPDYTRSVTEVYQEATVAFIRSSRNLTFLIHAVGEGDETLGLPSWCVDFSKRRWDWGRYGNLGGRDMEHHEKSEIIREYMSVLLHDASLGTLKVLGGVLGRVMRSRPLVSSSAFDRIKVTVQLDNEPGMDSGIDARTQLLLVSDFVKEVLQMTVKSYEVWERKDGAQAAKERIAAGELWETVFGGVLFNIVDAVCIRSGIERVLGDDRPRHYWIVEAFIRKVFPRYAKTLKSFGLLHPTPGLAETDRLGRALWKTLVLIAQVNDSKHWFSTDTGYIGRVDSALEEGDQLCSILGCKGPFILRSFNDGFRLIALPQSKDFKLDRHHTRVNEVKWEIFTLY